MKSTLTFIRSPLLCIAALFQFCCWAACPVVADSATKDCAYGYATDGASQGLVALPDLGQGSYQGYQGGLYPGGSNKRPAAHEAAGVSLATQITPLNGSGIPDVNGKIALLSIGFSNTTQEFSRFKADADADPMKNSKLVIVDGAQPTNEASDIIPGGQKYSIYRSGVTSKLSEGGVTTNQVVAAWIKETDAIPADTGVFPGQAQALQNSLAAIARELKSRFPNIKVAYYSSRTFTNYGRSVLDHTQPAPDSPEPYAYEEGFSIKWMIDDQIHSHPIIFQEKSAGLGDFPLPQDGDEK